MLSRGNGRQDIFLTDKDRYVFIDLLQEATERFGILICAYVMMGNHYHLLIKTTEANLSRTMQWFGTAYTRRFHIHNHSGGHLFQGRFKSILVENDAYLLRLSYYIHRNPLRAGLVQRLADYPWSSYLFYAYKKKAPAWLHTELILDQVGGDNPKAAYRRDVQRYAEEKGSPWEDVKHGLVYGSQGFIDHLKQEYLQSEKITELPQHNWLLFDTDPEIMAKQAAVAFGLDFNTICNVRRISSQDKLRRDMLIYFLWESGRLSNQAIAALLGMTYSNVSRRVSLLKQQFRDDKGLGAIYRQAKSQIKV